MFIARKNGGHVTGRLADLLNTLPSDHQLFFLKSLEVTQINSVYTHKLCDTTTNVYGGSTAGQP
jgi:hypothetical protein